VRRATREVVASPKRDKRRYLAENIRRLRLRRGWTQAVLAEKAGLEARYISTLESRVANPRVSVLVALAEALGVTLGPLFRRVSFGERPEGRPRGS
jgi:transcriptional regulator with XRE-family HTH domain